MYVLAEHKRDAIKLSEYLWRQHGQRTETQDRDDKKIPANARCPEQS